MCSSCRYSKTLLLPDFVFNKKITSCFNEIHSNCCLFEPDSPVPLHYFLT